MSSQHRKRLKEAKRIVVKVGSSLLASLKGGLEGRFIAQLADQIATLREEGREVILVSSGAVAAGTAELHWDKRPTELSKVQAAAAVGQGALMEMYRSVFHLYGITVAQILLTRDGLNDRKRFLYAVNTLRTLLDVRALPIINENDAIAVEELRLKICDNDALSTAVALMTEADALVILSDVPGLYTRHPKEEGAELISVVNHLTPEIIGMAGGSISGIGTGGMTSKVNAAKAARIADIPLVIAKGTQSRVLWSIFSGEEVGTLFVGDVRRESSWKQWIAVGKTPDGKVNVDEGAKNALLTGKKSLLPVGVKAIEGTFNEWDTVSICGMDGLEFARGLVNYSSEEARKIIGRRTEELCDILGYDAEETLIHRDNLTPLE